MSATAISIILTDSPHLLDPFCEPIEWREPTNGIEVNAPLDWHEGDPSFIPTFTLEPEVSAHPALAPVPRRSLRECVSDVETIADTVESLDCDQLTESEKTELGEMLISAISGSRKKVDATCSALAMFEARSGAAKTERDRLDRRVKYYDRQTERLEAYVLRVLDDAKLERLDGETSTLQKKLNPASVVIEPGARFSHEFMRYPDAPPAEPDKLAIKKGLQAKRCIPGASLCRMAKLVRS